MKNLIILFFFLISTQVFAQEWGLGRNSYWNNTSANAVRYTWNNNYWEGPSNLYYFNNNTCGYSAVPFRGFPLNSCSNNSQRLYTWNGYGYTNWNTARAPHWFWAETILNVVNTGIRNSNTNRLHNPGRYRTY